MNRFDDWDDVQLCNKCEHYWTSACDGSKCEIEDGSQTQNKTFCKTFTPTRRELISEELKVAQKRLNWLWWAVAFLAANHFILIWEVFK